MCVYCRGNISNNVDVIRYIFRGYVVMSLLDYIVFAGIPLYILIGFMAGEYLYKSYKLYRKRKGAM